MQTVFTIIIAISTVYTTLAGTEGPKAMCCEGLMQVKAPLN